MRDEVLTALLIAEIVLSIWFIVEIIRKRSKV
jgi:hypothetical protein